MLRVIRFITVLGLLIGFGLSAPALAQGSDPRSCAVLLDDQAFFPDSGVIVNTTGKPGDTVWVPISLRNTKVAAGFSLLVEVDTTFLKPLRDPASQLYLWKAGSRLIVNNLFNKTLSVAAEVQYTSPEANHMRLRVYGITDFIQVKPVVDTGRGVILSLGMQIAATAQQNDQTWVDWYYYDEYDSTVFPPRLVICQSSNYADTAGIYTGRLNTFPGSVRVDTAAVAGPIINSFTANPTTISPGGSTTLSWQTTNATSVTISGLAGPFALSGSRTLSLNSTTTFLLTATNASAQETSAQVTVTVSTTPGNNNPVVSQISPSAYTISQGENVSFSVTATDQDNDFITLAAQNLPANASFGTGGQVTGTGSATGNFSFTPNTTQEGTYVVGFRATDDRGGASTVVNVSITVEKIEYDILFSKSRAGGSPVGGLAGKRSILFPIDLVTSQDVYGVQFDMFYNPDFFDIDSIVTTNRTLDWVVYDNIGQAGVPPGELRIMTFSMEGNPLAIDSTNSTTILYVSMSIDSTAPWGNYPVYLEDGWESNNPDPGYPSLALVTDSGVIQVDRLGDVNLDQLVNVADAVNIVGTILGNFSLIERQFAAADIVTDAMVDVFDLVGVINTAFGLPVEQPQPAPAGGSEIFATVALDYDDMFAGSSDELVVRSELPEDVAGVQLSIRYDPAAVMLGKPIAGDAASRLQLAYKDNGAGQMLVLMHYSGGGEDLITQRIADLVRIPITAQSDIESGNESQLMLAEVKLATPTAKAIEVNGFGPTLPASFTLHQNYPNPFNPTTTIMFELSGTNQRVRLDIFNVLGQRVRSLLDKEMSAGEYAVPWDATTDNGSKVATGVYLYRLQAGDRSDTKKMLLLK